MRTIAALLFATLSVTGQDTKAQDAFLTDDEKIIHLLNRFTPGPTPALVADVKKAGLMEWFDRQLQGNLPETAAFDAAMKPLEIFPMTLDEIYTKYNGRYAKNASQEERAIAVAKHRQATQEHLFWLVLRAVHGSNPVRETSADFFRNHFSVSTDKTHVVWMVIGWEKEVVYGHALGTFPQMLDASAKNVAMLFYLDQSVSRRPYTRQELDGIFAHYKRTTQNEEMAQMAMDAAKQVAPNENYARELLELHTLGVDNGYTQKDVIEVSKCLTGWTMNKLFPWRFEFDPDMHVKGEKKVLGEAIAEGGDMSSADGDRVLEILKKHPNTAAYLSKKLVRFFVNDEPDPKMVERISKVWMETGGDLPKVYRAIVTDPEFFTRKNYQAKFKRPYEFLISAMRATGAQVTSWNSFLHGVEQMLGRMNEALYRCQDPTGYYDQAEAWRDPGAIATRWTIATELASGKIGGVRVSPSLYEGLSDDKPREFKTILAQRILPVAGLGARTSANIDRFVDAMLQKNPKAGVKDLAPKIVAVLLGSPEFQKQ